MLDNAWIIPLVPAASFFLILFFGKRLPRKGSEVGIAAVAVAFVLAIATNVQWFDHVEDPPAAHEATAEEAGEGTGHALGGEGELAEATTAGGVEGTGGQGGEVAAAAEEEEHEVPPVQRTWTWFEIGGVDVEAGMLLDGPAAMMLVVVTLVSLLVHVYSTDYVHGDRRYTHFFAFLSLFTASMLGLVMSTSTLQLLVCWELVGLCSFALIGHWWEEKANSDAALKAFITNRVGDVGLIVGVITLYFAAGQTFDIVDINSQALSGDISHLALLVASCSLVAAVMSKSGQFILHTWLPDAMAGPTPVSALIHAATMVVAGVYMVGRLYGVFFEGLSIGVSSVNLLAVVGAVTVLGGAGLAFVQNDIKKVLAYSTVSQLGYMVMALGVGAWTAAFFHLFTHAFFKACLFLGAGSVSHAVHSFDMRKDMGGLRRWMPHTYRTFLIATGALVGIFPLAGFWSKDEILAGASQLGGGGGYTAFMVVGIVGALMTAAYMTRVVYLTFFGEYRGHGHPHESGPRLTVPLWVLAVLGVTAGFANLPAAVGPGDGLDLRFEHFYEPKAPYFPTANFSHPEFSPGIAVTATIVAVLGIGVAYLWYWRGLGPHGITQRNRLARVGRQVLENKYYLDWLYTDVIVGAVKGPVARAAYWVNQHVIDGVVNGAGRGATAVGRFVYTRIDQQVVDGAITGSAAAANSSGQVFRQLTSGKVQQYGALLFGAAALFAGVIIIFV
ncbi:MAG TPA: NADH-quinone oxidoreductase subunit L [Acidimicrobiales bacterium]|nr:NADH-quinone oxidoreductase subunit L [Acidimicrobiales bacterium]